MGIPVNKLEEMGLIPEKITEVGRFQANGRSYDLFLGPVTHGMLCLIEDEVVGTTPDGRPLRVYGRACSPRLLQDHAVVISISSTGGGTRPQSSQSIVGVARGDVARVAVVDSEGAVHDVALNSHRAFAFSLDSQPGKAGATLASVVAYARDGREVERRMLSER